MDAEDSSLDYDQKMEAEEFLADSVKLPPPYARYNTPNAAGHFASSMDIEKLNRHDAESLKRWLKEYGSGKSKGYKGDKSDQVLTAIAYLKPYAQRKRVLHQLDCTVDELQRRYVIVQNEFQEVIKQLIN